MADSNNFKAQNAQGSFELFINRLLYRSYAHSEGDAVFDYRNPALTYPIRNFRVFENLYYGRIDPFLYAVEPYTNKMQGLNSEEARGQKALNFVAKAFGAMKEEILGAFQSRSIPQDNPYIVAMSPSTAFVNIDLNYNSYMTGLQTKFINFIHKRTKQPLYKEITSFETFIPIFTDFIRKYATERTLTKSSFLLSSFYGSINNSGLVIEIADLDKSDDTKKFDFINSDCFCYYVKVASKYGFYVDYNAPWRLIADVTSPPMIKYMEEEGVDNGSLPLLFKLYYKYTYLGETTTLKRLYFRTYRKLTGARPWFKDETWKGSCRYSEKKYRAKLGLAKFNENYPDSFWLEKYVTIKNWEKRDLFPSHELDRIIQNSQDLEKKFDNITAMGYINRKFKDSVATAAGSFNERVYAVKYEDQQNLPFTSFKKFLDEMYRAKSGNF